MSAKPAPAAASQNDTPANTAETTVYHGDAKVQELQDSLKLAPRAPKGPHVVAWNDNGKTGFQINGRGIFGSFNTGTVFSHAQAVVEAAKDLMRMLAIRPKLVAAILADSKFVIPTEPTMSEMSLCARTLTFGNFGVLDQAYPPFGPQVQIQIARALISALPKHLPAMVKTITESKVEVSDAELLLGAASIRDWRESCFFCTEPKAMAIHKEVMVLPCGHAYCSPCWAKYKLQNNLGAPKPHTFQTADGQTMLVVGGADHTTDTKNGDSAIKCTICRAIVSRVFSTQQHLTIGPVLEFISERMAKDYIASLPSASTAAATPASTATSSASSSSQP